MSNLNRTDQIIFVVAALLLAAFSYFLYDDSLLFPQQNTAGLEQIGSVSSSSNDVRLKTAQAFTWFPAQKSDNVHLMDSVFTGERSTAVIQLKDGTQISLKENSLVTLSMKDGQMNLDLRYGDLSSKLGGKSAVTITSGEKTFELEGQGSIQIKKKSSGNMNLSLVEGTAKLKDKKGQRALEPSQPVSFDTREENRPKSQPEKRPEDQPVIAGKVELVTPDGSFASRATPDAPFSLNWKSEGPIANFRLDLCDTADCQKPVKSFETKELKATITEPLPDGKYHWRVAGLDKLNREAALSEIRGFEITVVKPPTITTPGGNPAVFEAKIRVRKADEKLTSSAQLSWSADAAFASYEYEIADEKEFQAPVHREALEKTDVVTPKFTNGLYVYRVRGVLKNGRKTDWSEVAEFQMKLTPELPAKMPAPVLSQKQYLFDVKEEAKRQPAATAKPSFAWTSVPKAVSYQVEIARDAAFKKERVSFKLKAQAMKWGEYKPGKWHVRVVASDAEGMNSLPSEISTLEVVMGIPVIEPMAKVEKRAASLSQEAPPIEIPTRWTPIPGAASYVMQVSATPGFESPTQVQTRAPESKIAMPGPGKFFLRVQALDPENRPLSGFSAAETGEYVFKSILNAPILREPFNKASIFLQSTQEPNIWLEWKKSPEADGYDVEVATDASFQNVFVRARSPERRFLVQKQVPVGTLHWRVRAITPKTGRPTEWSEVWTFTIHSKQKEASE